MKNSFKNWIFKQRDIDVQLISLLIATAISGFIGDFTRGVVDPIVEGVMPNGDEASYQQVGPFKFKLQKLISGFIKMIILFLIVYQVALVTKNI